MAKRRNTAGKGGNALAMMAVAGLALAVPSAGLAIAGIDTGAEALSRNDLAFFTPATVDPQLARRVAAVAGAKAVRFTPADMSTRSARSVTVAVRIDEQAARAISVRNALKSVAGEPGKGIVTIAPTRYNLGMSRGYESFAKPITLPETVNRVAMPDLASFKPREGSAVDKPGRFQPRLAFEKEGHPGRAPNTLESLGEQIVDVGGAYRVMRNLDLTAGVRLSQDRDRIEPLTNSVQDSQAVYVGTQFRF